MRGIVSIAGYIPYRRLDRTEVPATFGTGGGRGTRSVASYDEDTTTMGVEAARLVRRSAPEA
ncbi:MAG: hydroxymethylglutaryl-CoA synthase, partial [Actinomycetota bacterium]